MSLVPLCNGRVQINGPSFPAKQDLPEKALSTHLRSLSGLAASDKDYSAHGSTNRVLSSSET